MSSETEIMEHEPTDAGTKIAASGGILAALAMTSCCILPLVLFSLGATGAWIGRMGALYQYKWYFASFAALTIGYGFYKVYWQTPKACADGTCTRPVNQRVMKGSLWAATGVVAASMLFPSVAPYFLGY